MKHGPFLSLIADRYHVEEKTVVVYARFLREAGLLTSGARGVNAPHMRPIDAARITLALLGTDSPARAVEAVRRYGALKIRRNECEGDLPEILFYGEPTLENVLTRIFAAPLCGHNVGKMALLVPYVEINENARTATVECAGAVKAVFRNEGSAGRDDFFGIRRLRGVASSETLPIWVALQDGKYFGSDANGLPLDPNHPWNLEGTTQDRFNRRVEIEEYLNATFPEWQEGA